MPTRDLEPVILRQTTRTDDREPVVNVAFALTVGGR
jgi:hypothetical protein